ncbi:putative Histone acetyltransferase [Verrucomicrobia bacterium]|nr:putative Histone acetyltransferase [Verrucomicrobiota bacterium]
MTLIDWPASGYVRQTPFQLIMKMNLFLSSRVQKTFIAASLGLAVLPAGVEAAPAPQWLQGGDAARITGVACSPDGTMIASASEDGTVKLWSTNGTLLRTLDTQPYPTTAVAWSPDGAKIAAGTYYGGWASGRPGLGLTCLWQATSGWTNSVNLVRVTTNCYGKVSALAFSADSTRLAAGCAAGSNLVTSVGGGSVVARCPAYNTSVRPAAVTSVAFSSRGMMASGCEDATVCVYSTSSWSQLWYSTTAHWSNVTAVAFSPDGTLLATASLDQTVKIWSTNGWTLQNTLTGDTNGFASVAFSPDGQKIVSGGKDGTVEIWNWSSGACLVTIAADALPVTKTVFSTDGSLVISGSDDGTIRLWSAADGSPVCTLGSQNYFIGAVAISPDGTLCASAGGSETVQVRKTSDGALVQTLAANTNYVSSVAFSPDSERLASGGGPLDPTIKIWQISNGTLLTTIPATTNGVMALAWSPDGLTLASGGDSVEQNITFWDTNGIQHGILPGALSGHTNGVTALAFSPQGNLLASGGRRPGNMVQIWTNNIPGIWTTGIVVQSFISPSTSNNVECVTFSRDGTLVAWGRDAPNDLKIGSIANGTNPSLGSGTNPVFSVAFSPDGSTLAATYQNTIQFWTNGSSWSSWALCETVTNEVVRACCLAYSPNGNLFVCGREDGTVTMSPNTRGALGQPALTFTGITLNAMGATTISGSVQPWTEYVLFSSTNLTDWSFLTLAVSSSKTLTIAGPSISNAPANFFLATTPP